MNIGGYSFHGPFTPHKGFVEDVSAVYVILDSGNIVIDVGQSGNLNNRFPNHDRQSQWESCTSGPLSLYIMREGNERTRLNMESIIRQHYKPPCGDR